MVLWREKKKGEGKKIPLDICLCKESMFKKKTALKAMGFLESLLLPLRRSLNTKHQIFFSLSKHAELAKKLSPKKKFTFNFLQFSHKYHVAEVSAQR